MIENVEPRCPLCRGLSICWEGALITAFYQDPETPPIKVLMDGPMPAGLDIKIKHTGVINRLTALLADCTAHLVVGHEPYSVTTGEVLHLSFNRTCIGCDGRRTHTAYARKKFLAGAPSADTDPR